MRLDALTYRLLADAVLLAHFAVVVFVVGGLLLIFAGNLRHWRWVNLRWLRVLHILAIGVVVAQSWLGKLCPLTTLESWLRQQGGGAGYEASFVEHWVEKVLYFQAPWGLFTLLYTVFGLLVLAAWWYFPPRDGHEPAHRPQPTAVPPASFLAACVQNNAFTDCYAVSVPGTVTLPDLIEAFYTTRLFKLERWLLAKALNIPSTDEDAALLARTGTPRFCAWRVEQRSDDEILLDAGQTRSWLSVRPPTSSAPESTTLLFGSAVLPMRPGGKFGPVFHALLGFHRLYSKLLLAGAARRVIVLRERRSAA